jgi:hypothetical protein
MKWLSPQAAGGRPLNHLAQIHDADDIRYMSDDSEIVRDEQDTEVQVARERDEQIRNLRLHRSVECRNRFVGDDDAWIAH